MSEARSKAYTQAGVNLEAGYSLVERIKGMVKKTRVDGVLSDIGGFGGLFQPNITGMEEPLLVASTDGVGTKLKLAFVFNKHDTVGIDLVAMSVNDLLVQGAKPLFFLDYFATGKLDVDTAAQVVQGVADGCVQSSCALLGGETAEMPSMYPDGEYDLAGFCVGIVDKKKLVTGNAIKEGDVLIGIASSGIHSNGYSLVRKLFDQSGCKPTDIVPGDSKDFKTVLLEPTKIYVKTIQKLLQAVVVKGMVHVTGGGFYENIPRVLPTNVQAEITFTAWEKAPIFEWLAQTGGLSWPEMLQIFNSGIGFVVVVDAADTDTTLRALHSLGEKAWAVGTVQKRATAESEQVVVHF